MKHIHKKMIMRFFLLPYINVFIIENFHGAETGKQRNSLTLNLVLNIQKRIH